jgi:hypothetical protein
LFRSGRRSHGAGRRLFRSRRRSPGAGRRSSRSGRRLPGAGRRLFRSGRRSDGAGRCLSLSGRRSLVGRHRSFRSGRRSHGAGVAPVASRTAFSGIGRGARPQPRRSVGEDAHAGRVAEMCAAVVPRQRRLGWAGPLRPRYTGQAGQPCGPRKSPFVSGTPLCRRIAYAVVRWKKKLGTANCWRN